MFVEMVRTLLMAAILVSYCDKDIGRVTGALQEVYVFIFSLKTFHGCFDSPIKQQSRGMQSMR